MNIESPKPLFKLEKVLRSRPLTEYSAQTKNGVQLDEYSLSCNDSLSNNEQELSIMNLSIRQDESPVEEIEDFVPKIKMRRSPKKPSLSS